MKYTYTALFSLEPGTKETYNVTFPDLPGCLTYGDTLSEAVENAEDVLNLWLYDKEEDGMAIPSASAPVDLKHLVGNNSLLSIVAADTEKYRQTVETKNVKKTLTIPMWLNKKAEEAHINFSQTLQRALKMELNV